MPDMSFSDTSDTDTLSLAIGYSKPDTETKEPQKSSTDPGDRSAEAGGETAAPGTSGG